nr:MAG TPA: hypothetical protein [Caudoviricetes sp.]
MTPFAICNISFAFCNSYNRILRKKSSEKRHSACCKFRRSIA